MNFSTIGVGLSGMVLLAAASCAGDDAPSSATGAGGATASSSTATQASSNVTASASMSASEASQSSTTAAVVTVAVSGGGLIYVAHCNPVSNEGCLPGEACDFSIKGTFMCFEPPNDVALCGTCDSNNGPFCMGGLTCEGGSCVKYCCGDGDCGTGTCSKTDENGEPHFNGLDLGFCLDKDKKAACDAPLSPPSNGSCIQPQ